VFEDDEKIKLSLEMVDEFFETHIDQENQNDPAWIMQKGENPEKFQDKITNNHMIFLKNNQIPRGLIPLESLFDQDDIPLNSTLIPQPEEVEDCNVGTNEDPKMVKISKYLQAQIKSKYIEFLRQYKYSFSWSYDNLKTYDTSIIEHKIPLKHGIKPFRKNIRHINPILLSMIEREVNKILDAKIIVPLRYSEWVGNLVLVRKTNDEIRLYIDFRNLNRSSLKDNYPLLKMDHVLEKVVGANMIYMIDGFSVYNQIIVHEDDNKKNVFTTPWGTFMYDKIPFGLMNA
jgi:hypothetical protein